MPYTNFYYYCIYMWNSCYVGLVVEYCLCAESGLSKLSLFCDMSLLVEKLLHIVEPTHPKSGLYSEMLPIMQKERVCFVFPDLFLQLLSVPPNICS